LDIKIGRSKIDGDEEEEYEGINGDRLEDLFLASAAAAFQDASTTTLA
jgi:hypothetical protein